MPEKTKACFYCGEQPEIYEAESLLIQIGSHACCDNCGVAGPVCENIEKASRYWNHMMDLLPSEGKK